MRLNSAASSTPVAPPPTMAMLIAALSEAAHHVRANARIERIGLIVAVDEVTVFDDASCAKVVGPAAEGQDQKS